MQDDLVITGVCCASPLGPDWDSTWRGIVSGRTATRQLDAWPVDDPRLPPASDYVGAPLAALGAVARRRSLVAAGAIGDDGEADASPSDTETNGESFPLLDDRGGEFVDPLYDITKSVVAEAIERSLLSHDLIRSPRTGCVFGNSKGSVWAQSVAACGFQEEPQDFYSLFPGGPSTAIIREYGMTGPTHGPVAACATGLVSLLYAADLIRSGIVDRVICGAADASLHPAVLASAHRLGVHSNEEEPTDACRPFDRNRSGFVVGEGGAAFVLESRQSAERRGAEILAGFLGGRFRSDPTALTAVDVSGRLLAGLIDDTVASLGVRPARIDHINFHGTATRANDLAESRGVRIALRRDAERISGTSCKGQIGHLLGAAGAVESAMTVAAIRHQIVPPTANLTDPDPACGLDYTPLKAVSRPIRTALKLSLGFGGTIAAGIFTRAD